MRANSLALLAAARRVLILAVLPAVVIAQPAPSVPTPFADRASAASAASAATSADRDPAPPQRGILPNAPLPPDPARTERPVVFGSQIFSGRFGAVSFAGFNPDYLLSVGDRVHVRMWGAYNFDATQTIDAQGNIFLANVGPVRLLGVRNADLNSQVESQVKRVYRRNVSVYATLGAAQPVKVYVTGFVRAPGLYGGLSSDSILYYLDQAGGIDPDRGSFLDVELRRNGASLARFDLYRFLLEGKMQSLQLHDGDTLVAQPRQYTVQVGGRVLNPYIFEFNQPTMPASSLLALARPRPDATHMSIARRSGAQTRSEYHAIDKLQGVEVHSGDEINFTSDKYPGTIFVRVEGAQLSEHTLVLPYGARLRDALARVTPAPQARMEAVQLFRESVKQRQKDALNNALRNLETYALTARSATSEEAALRKVEAELILNFIERAKTVQPKGQVVLAQKEMAPETLLEDGDLIRIPQQSNLILVSGEVLFPNALIYEREASAADYVQQAGGFTQSADKARLIVLHEDGSVDQGRSTTPRPGDEVLVLPKIETKSIEITRGITQILYQIAIAAKVALDL